MILSKDIMNKEIINSLNIELFDLKTKIKELEAENNLAKDSKKELNQIVNLYSKFQEAKRENEFGIEDKYLFGLAEALVNAILNYKDLNSEIIRKFSDKKFSRGVVNLLADTIYFSEDFENSALNPDKMVLSEGTNKNN